MRHFIRFMTLMISFLVHAEEMRLEEKIGQLLMVHFHGEEANDEARELIQNLHVGGIIYYNWANGLHSPEQVRHLSQGLQSLAKLPLIIAVDQEGGRINRLKNGFTIFPSNGAVAQNGDPDVARSNAFITGQELLNVGVNMNLAPVVDVNSSTNKPVMGDRSFGDSPDLVIRFAEKALEGYRQAGILSSLKHFPGHGDVDTDSHVGLPMLSKSREEIEKCDLKPFIALAKKADSVMTAHILVPALDPTNCMTLSPSSLTILRDHMNHDGVILSDSLIMEGLLKNCTSIEEAAIRAINAGCDMLILGGKQLIGEHVNFELTLSDIQRIHQKLVQAVKQGDIKEERLNEAVRRILSMKQKTL